ncbi:glycosyltransferase family 2 protein [Isoptericola sp. NEAU-Y5]|uniref:Glycosyltransferase family 2 protein n=1 Tax=Isoptericola luteus TaxID=2879484 RepID=A0ABS7ZD87_9MICO|nr:glycosyltransferase family A protein [Isoptericola sp. NEAU-Y5]MCA5892888.1 glycosyltransferase family 2 protein [Isoptericola sp. NEAU-Y5]
MSAGTVDRPLVSVVVATNRGGPFLAEALDSVEAQTYPRIEVVLVDDGSEDPEAIRRIVAGRPTTTVVRQSAGGVSTARNVGVSHTRGELLVFLDDDDRWHPQRIELQVEAMADGSVVASYCGMRTVGVDGEELVAADQHQVRDVHDVLRRTMGIILPNLMTRRDTFVRVGGFHPAFRRAQDLDLVIRLALAGDLRFVDRTLVDYRRHGNNNTRRYRELCRSIDHVVRLHAWAAYERGREDLVADYRASLARNRRYAAWRATASAREHARRGRPGAAVGDLVWLARFAPRAPVDWLAERTRRLRAASERGVAAPDVPAPGASAADVPAAQVRATDGTTPGVTAPTPAARR